MLRHPHPAALRHPAAEQDILFASPTRIDEPHREHPARKAAKSLGQPVTFEAVSRNEAAIRNAQAIGQGRPDCDPGTADVCETDAWLKLHAAELIAKLQQSADALDAREARLNAQIALHERREREFRLWRESQRVELDTLRDEAERLRDELRAEARRIALRSETPR